MVLHAWVGGLLLNEGEGLARPSLALGPRLTAGGSDAPRTPHRSHMWGREYGLLKSYFAPTTVQLRGGSCGNSYLLLGRKGFVVVVVAVELERLLEEMDVSTGEVLAYVKYFDYKRSRGLRKTWEHYTIRLFVLSVADLGNGYYSALRKVKDEVVLKDATDAELFEWLKGWIFRRDKGGQWWIVVDGDSEDFSEFKRVYEQVKRREL